MQSAPYTVSSLNREIRNLVESSFRSIWVVGEISNLARPSSGHMYFSLKEENSVIRCAWFRNRQLRSPAQPEDGMQVTIRAQVSFYEARGELQLIVEYMEEAGEGLLRRQFEELKKKLDSEGLFSPDRKRPLPEFPGRIGLVTSLTGAAVRDVLTTINRRFPATSVLLFPVQVQGEKAEQEICQAIEHFSSRNDTDVVIVARGGGSLEDLQAFNLESVARAISACPIPVIAGIGHETDFTIADFVADRRAATPTAAAELAAPDMRSLLRRIAATGEKIYNLVNRELRDLGQTVDILQSRLTHPREKLVQFESARQNFQDRILYCAQSQLWESRAGLDAMLTRFGAASPATQMGISRQRLSTMDRLLLTGVKNACNQRQIHLQSLRGKIDILGPQNTLNRGYALVRNADGDVVVNAAMVKAGDKVQVKVSRGDFDATVNS